MDRTMLALVAGTAPIDVSTGASACDDAPVDSSPTLEGLLTDALALGVCLDTRSGDSDGQGRVSPNTMEGLASDFSSLSFWRGGRSGRMVARGGLNEDDDVRKLTEEALLASARSAAVVTPRDHLHQVRPLVSPLLQPTFVPHSSVRGHVLFVCTPLKACLIHSSGGPDAGWCFVCSFCVRSPEPFVSARACPSLLSWPPLARSAMLSCSTPSFSAACGNGLDALPFCAGRRWGRGGVDHSILQALRYPPCLFARPHLLNRKLLSSAKCLGALKPSRVSVSRRVLGTLGAILSEMTQQREALGVKHGNLFAYHLGQRAEEVDVLQYVANSERKESVTAACARVTPASLSSSIQQNPRSGSLIPPGDGGARRHPSAWEQRLAASARGNSLQVPTLLSPIVT